ncbi:MAG: NAD-dependent epimerase/dehydratase family protein, partial [Chloroflexota bacterium]|nr:NAD-dependent epimerase/dehydratase family protein [Chloroflexota bacterium]
MSRILITGAAGLIGTALTRRLGAAGHDVIGFDIA